MRASDFKVALALGQYRRQRWNVPCGLDATRSEGPVDASRRHELCRPARRRARCSPCSSEDGRARRRARPSPPRCSRIAFEVWRSRGIIDGPLDAIEKAIATPAGKMVITHHGSSPRSLGCSKPATGSDSQPAVDFDKPFRRFGRLLAAAVDERRQTRRLRTAARRLSATVRGERPWTRKDRDLLLGLASPAGFRGLADRGRRRAREDDRPQARRLAGARLEAALAASSQRDPGRTSESNGVGIFVAFFARGWMCSAGRDRPRAATAASQRAQRFAAGSRRGRFRPPGIGRARRSSTRSVRSSRRRAIPAQGADRVQETVCVVPSTR